MRGRSLLGAVRTPYDEQDVIRDAVRGAPTWITTEAGQDPLKTFQPFYGSDMSPEQALEILLNIGHLFSVLDRRSFRQQP